MKRLVYSSLFLYINIMRKNVIVRRRVYCEDTSGILKSIRSGKKHGKTVEINGLQYEHVGDDMLYCLKTSRIKKLEK